GARTRDGSGRSAGTWRPPDESGRRPPRSARKLPCAPSELRDRRTGSPSARASRYCARPTPPTVIPKLDRAPRPPVHRHVQPSVAGLGTPVDYRKYTIDDGKLSQPNGVLPNLYRCTKPIQLDSDPSGGL